MKNKTIYVEGGGDAKDLRSQCRKGFPKLLESSGFRGRLPRIVACGSRRETYDDFSTAHKQARAEYVAMLVDSEDPVDDIDKPWDHLAARPGDNWQRPEQATDEQVLLMTTCMETWIVTDHKTIQKHYGNKLQTSALPSTFDLEKRDRHAVQDALIHATRNCSNGYRKDKRSFEALSKLDPVILRKMLPSFARMVRILEEKL